MSDAYRKLETRFARIVALDDAAGMLFWDRAAMMPAGAAEARTRQITALRLTVHEFMSDPAMVDLLAQAEADATGLDPWQAANLRAMRRRWRHATALPADLVAARTKANGACEMAWRQARPANDFAALIPHLETVLALTRQAAAAKAEALGLAPYDALLDQFEAGLQSTLVDGLFDDLADYLPGLIDQVPPAPADNAANFAAIDTARQQAVSQQLIGHLGFDKERGRLDISLHPFTGGVPDDVRITTRYAEDDIVSGLMGTIHETGHGLYEQGLPADWRSQPVGASMGMVVHESQSLLLEMQAGRSDAFMQFLSRLLARTLGSDGEAFTPPTLKRRLRRVRPSLIRVDADEVTYPLHVILRTRLERRLLDGTLTVAELPQAWAQESQALLGFAPPDDRDGAMQDIHWMEGLFGYFPTYTLGAIAAAQIFAAARQDLPTLERDLAEGKLADLLIWLRRKIHSRGRLHDSVDALLSEATGAPLNLAPFKAHLEERYLS